MGETSSRKSQPQSGTKGPQAALSIQRKSAEGSRAAEMMEFRDAG